jgi:prophage regulatory protein
MAIKPPSRRMLAFEDLSSKGIKFSRGYLRELWEQGRFPKPVYLSPRKLAWEEAAIDQWLADRIALSNYKVG